MSPANQQSSADAGFAFGLQIGCQRSRAADSVRLASRTNYGR